VVRAHVELLLRRVNNDCAGGGFLCCAARRRPTVPKDVGNNSGAANRLGAAVCIFKRTWYRYM
jgi:hypothetical protein